MGVRNELVQSVGKGQVHADSLSLAPSPFPFPPQLQSTLPPSPPPRLQGTEAVRGKVVISAAFKYSTGKAWTFFFLFFFPSCAAI